MFTDEATFHLSGKVNRHKVRIWGTENPREIEENVRDSPKLIVFGAVSSVKVYGHFFFAEPTVTGISYLDMLENYLMPQLQQYMDRDFIFQQDGAPSHIHREVTSCLTARWLSGLDVVER